MQDDMTLFNGKDTKTETITIRVSPKQKERIYLMALAQRMNLSQFILSLIGQEYKRQTSEEVIDIYEDGPPF